MIIQHSYLCICSLRSHERDSSPVSGARHVVSFVNSQSGRSFTHTVIVHIIPSVIRFIHKNQRTKLPLVPMWFTYIGKYCDQYQNRQSKKCSPLYVGKVCYLLSRCYNTVTPAGRLKAMGTQLFVQHPIQVNDKSIIKASHYWSFCEGNSPVNPSTKGQ